LISSESHVRYLSISEWSKNFNARMVAYVITHCVNAICCLDIFNCNFRADDMKLLLPALKGTKLVSLNLSSNELGDKTINVLAPALKDSNLEALNLGSFLLFLLLLLLFLSSLLFFS
jgi:hypothetical protein